MIMFAGLVAGAVYGVFKARQLKGTRADMAQYAAGYGIFLGLVGLLVMLVLSRTI